MQLTDEPEKRCYPLGDHLYCRSCHIRQGEKLGYASSDSVRFKMSILFTGSNNQFRICETEFSGIFGSFRTSFTYKSCLFIYYCFFSVKNNLIGSEICGKNSGFVVSELVVGSGEQESKIIFSLLATSFIF